MRFPSCCSDIVGRERDKDIGIKCQGMALLNGRAEAGWKVLHGLEEDGFPQIAQLRDRRKKIRDRFTVRPSAGLRRSVGGSVARAPHFLFLKELQKCSMLKNSPGLDTCPGESGMQLVAGRKCQLATNLQKQTVTRCIAGRGSADAHCAWVCFAEFPRQRAMPRTLAPL